MKCIQVSPGYEALVDDEDYERLSRFRWCCNGGYPARGYNENGKVKIIKMHRDVIGEVPTGFEIDHINGNRFDNQKCNLRLITHQQNCFNRGKIKKPCSSKYKGVVWRKDCQKWQSCITVGGKKRSLGFFLHEDDAARAYNNTASQIFGEFARLNQIGGS